MPDSIAVLPARTGTPGRTEPASAALMPSSAEFEAAFKLHHRRVFAAAYRVTGNAMDAEDVLQTVFVRLLDRAAWLPEPELGPFLRRSAVNAALDAVRYRKRRPTTTLETQPSLSEAETLDTSDGDVLDRVRAGLAAMSPNAAQMFILK